MSRVGRVWVLLIQSFPIAVLFLVRFQVGGAYRDCPWYSPSGFPGWRMANPGIIAMAARAVTRTRPASCYDTTSLHATPPGHRDICSGAGCERDIRTISVAQVSSICM